ncbi:molybdopterin-guanine dinucleotide biosynthesis protein B [Oceanisphaera profunda]|uniref:Molybdopterin-guanine dinucleotide biosynthesis protein B n=1 Tax=Oceanisphaera profunda TaxID=1416627 RepID=A0A1Y0D251_9GAMM|nr:molybdopterin-guanine dinucleotide biosynthesis protein B [Oceanisphaera profunda]
MTRSHCSYALLGFAGFSGSGKTTLLRQLVHLLSQRGLRIGLIKHTHHDVEQDRPGKDSFELRHAGAQQCLLAGPKRTIVTFENPIAQEPDLYESLARLRLDQLDLILVEGFRDATINKIEVHRPACQRPLLCQQDPHILALATDDLTLSSPVPLLDLNDAVAIAEQIMLWWQTGRLRGPALSVFHPQDSHSGADSSHTTKGVDDGNADAAPGRV